MRRKEAIVMRSSVHLYSLNQALIITDVQTWFFYGQQDHLVGLSHVSA